jgi:hypothetical protein
MAEGASELHIIRGALPRVHNGAMVPAVPSASSKRRERLAGLAALAAVLALPVGAEIFRCTSPTGAVSYQQASCPESDVSRVVDVPSSYPNADPAQRRQLFAREAALDRRLEARRERESREAIARAELTAAQAAARQAQPQPADSQPLWLPLPFPRSRRFVRAHSGAHVRSAHRS